MGSVGQCVRTGWGWEIKFIYSLEYRVALKSIQVMHCWPTAESLGTKVYIASIHQKAVGAHEDGGRIFWKTQDVPPRVEPPPLLFVGFLDAFSGSEHKTMQRVRQGRCLISSDVSLDMEVGRRTLGHSLILHNPWGKAKWLTNLTGNSGEKNKTKQNRGSSAVWEQTACNGMLVFLLFSKPCLNSIPHWEVYLSPNCP